MPQMRSNSRGGKPPVDWGPIKAAYVGDPCMSHTELATRFGVSLQSVKKRSHYESWGEARQRVSAEADRLLEEKLANERLKNVEECNLQDLRTVDLMHGLAIEELIKAKAESGIDVDRLAKLATIFEKGQKMKRLALGISTSNAEVSGKDGAPLNPIAPPTVNISFTKRPADAGGG